MLNIGLLGCGRIGQVHALSIGRLDDVRVTAVADAFPEAAQSLADRIGAQVMDPDAVIASAKVDAVVIATPTADFLPIRQFIDAVLPVVFVL